MGVGDERLYEVDGRVRFVYSIFGQFNLEAPVDALVVSS